LISKEPLFVAAKIIYKLQLAHLKGAFSSQLMNRSVRITYSSFVWFYCSSSYHLKFDYLLKHVSLIEVSSPSICLICFSSLFGFLPRKVSLKIGTKSGSPAKPLQYYEPSLNSRIPKNLEWVKNKESSMIVSGNKWSFITRNKRESVYFYCRLVSTFIVNKNLDLSLRI